MMDGAGDTACRQGFSSQDPMVHQSRARGHLQDGLHRASAGSCGIVLCCAVLCCAVLCCAVLRCAALCCAVLRCAALCCAVLRCAALCCAVLRCAALCCAVLRCAAMLCCHAVLAILLEQTQILFAHTHVMSVLKFAVEPHAVATFQTCRRPCPGMRRGVWHWRAP